jgi:hypothetical protein
MHLAPRTTHESKSIPGCTFVTRRLNSIQRAKRDAGIAEHRREYTRLTTELSALVRRYIGDGTPEERQAKLSALEPAKTLEMNALDDGARLVLDEHIRPAVIRAALVSIEGADGITLESLFDEAPDELIEEIDAACNAASGLTAEQQKN